MGLPDIDVCFDASYWEVGEVVWDLKNEDWTKLVVL